MGTGKESWVIYGLHENTKDSEFRYIGYSTVEMWKTLKRHLVRDQHYGRGLKDNWIHKVGPENVTYDVIEQCPKENLEFLYAREIYWIAYYRAFQGSHDTRFTDDYLTNMADGGLGIRGHRWTMTHEQRLNCSIAQKARDLESFLRGESHPSYGKKHTKETRKKISEVQIGRKASEETRKKMSEMRKGENNAFYGKTHSDETRAKISAAGIGRVDSEATREKRRQSLTGRSTSPESKLRSSFTKHIQHHVERTPKRKYTCRWCNGDTLDQAIKDILKEDND